MPFSRDLPDPGINPAHVSYVSCASRWVFTTEPQNFRMDIEEKTDIYLQKSNKLLSLFKKKRKDLICEY